MSKPTRTFCFVFLTIGIFSGRLAVQSRTAVWSYPPIVAYLAVEYQPRPQGKITGRFWRERAADRRKTFSFASSVAGMNLGDRISQLALEDTAGKPIPFRQIGVGEYLAERDIDSWSYTVDLRIQADLRKAAHTSWLSTDVGILMLADLLPEFGPWSIHDAWINVVPPTDWAVHGLSPLSDSYEAPLLELPRVEGGQWYALPEYQKAVFVVGKGWRYQKLLNSPLVELTISGNWHFTDDEARGMVREIRGKYRDLFESEPGAGVFISIAKFPGQVKPGEWQAETRGRNVTIISSDMPFRTQSLQRLHEQLRHELFHLWIPNNVNLTGNYDWFYEGFALYQSLKLAVSLNRIRFDDFLDTLSRAHTIDSAFTQRPSLIEASRNRFSGLNTQIYARGMLVAFLVDLALMEKSKASVEDLLRKIYIQHRKPSPATDGNKAVIDIMQANPALDPIVRRYVAGSETINWTSELAAAGIEDADSGPLTTLRVKEKPSGRQKTVLDKLGYNNWRKLAPNSR